MRYMRYSDPGAGTTDAILLRRSQALLRSDDDLRALSGAVYRSPHLSALARAVVAETSVAWRLVLFIFFCLVRIETGIVGTRFVFVVRANAFFFARVITGGLADEFRVGGDEFIA